MQNSRDGFKPDIRNLPTMEEVNFYHLSSDKDSGPGALHHTLGLGPSQASPGNHNHDGRNSKRIKASALAPDDVSYQPMGGASITQPTFSGDPLITGDYAKFGSLCHFNIDVDFDNITSFGDGQYYLTLPFTSEHTFFATAGFLFDSSTGDYYAMSGKCDANSTQLNLFSVASNGRNVPFTHNVPVTLDVADNFVISGTYHVKQ